MSRKVHYQDIHLWYAGICGTTSKTVLLRTLDRKHVTCDRCEAELEEADRKKAEKYAKLA